MRGLCKLFLNFFWVKPVIARNHGKLIGEQFCDVIGNLKFWGPRFLKILISKREVFGLGFFKFLLGLVFFLETF